MNVTVRKVGNSKGLILPQEVLKQLAISEGDELSVTVVNGKVVLEPVGSDLSEQLQAARIGMRKYRAALSELAK